MRRYSFDIPSRVCQDGRKSKFTPVACYVFNQVNHEQFHRILDEYREAKRRELDLELKAKQ